MKNIYLIGMMGSGKSITAQVLSKKIEKKFVDLDEKVQEKVGMTISEIFKQQGEPFFRLQEAIQLREVSQQGDCVVATGGGIVLNPQNIRRMKETGTVITLKGTFETLWQRVKKNKDRPLLASDDPESKLRFIYKDREKLYTTTGDYFVETDGLTAEEVANKIMEIIGVSK